jgi:hypothetical protein
MVKKQKTCRHIQCDDELYLGGFCQAHHDESERQRIRRKDAINALHNLSIDGRLPDAPTLREELHRIGNWWQRACVSVQQKISSELLPYDEASYALEWCIALAQEIVDAERAFRTGAAIGGGYDATREWVWDRFNFLEQGLSSNGMPRDNVSRK